MKTTNRVAVVLLFLLASTVISMGQSRQAANAAYKDWKEKALSNLDNKQSYKFQGIGAAVEKIQANGITVNFSVGASLNTKEIKPLIFSVQPLSITTENNVSVTREIGDSSKLGSPKIERTREDKDEIILSPQITLPITSEVNAVKLTISGFENDPLKVYTMILPVSSEIKSAAIGILVSKN